MLELTLTQRIEAALFASPEALPLERLAALAPAEAGVQALRAALAELAEAYCERAVELVETAAGFRFQVRANHARAVAGLFAERAPRYSRALLETLAVIAYRQPVTRAEIEDLRGVSLGTTLLRTLLDRGWVRSAGHRDLPGRPAVYVTTRAFLDHFGMRGLSELPPLAEVRSLTEIEPELPLFAPAPDAQDPA